MAYDPNPTRELDFQQENLMDYGTAKIGQWFIGVLDTARKKVFIVPVNVFEGTNGELNTKVLDDNDHQRGMNRYASGTVEDRSKDPKVREAKYKKFQTFKNGNWLEVRGAMQHHVAVAVHYGSAIEDCLGFTIIKVAEGGFGQMKCSSNSLNAKVKIKKTNFSQITYNIKHGVDYGSTGSYQMPDDWRASLEAYLKGDPYKIVNLVTSND